MYLIHESRNAETASSALRRVNRKKRTTGQPVVLIVSCIYSAPFVDHTSSILGSKEVAISSAFAKALNPPSIR